MIEAVGLAPVDAFGSSGGGMCALHWVVAHSEDIYTLVSHEPPLVTLLEDREIAIKANADIVDTYQRDGFGPAMAKFMQLVMRQSPLPADYLDATGTWTPGAVRAADRGRRVTRRPAA